jgi:cytochrome c peroxidase
MKPLSRLLAAVAPGLPAFRTVAALATAMVLAACSGSSAPEDPDAALAPIERLGKRLFEDTALSEPAGQSCASCHDAARAFTDPDEGEPTSEGVVPGRFGSRNTPGAAYAMFAPPRHYDAQDGTWVGGLFLDGRAPTLEEQAKLPFLNALEMANPDKRAVVAKVGAASYAPLFRQVFGDSSFDDPELAYERLAQAIAAFERTRAFAPFSSKFDLVLKGEAQFTAQEARGRDLFVDEKKGNCAACHPATPAKDGTPPLFTDFTYDNLGVPRNPDNRFYGQAPAANPEGAAFVDRGLGGAIAAAAEDGKFKVPTLRNIARTAPYMHNGYFRDLKAVVRFYNDRDARPRCADPLTRQADAQALGCWPAPETAATMNREELGDLRLTDAEVDDIVAFLGTLSDGYRP